MVLKESSLDISAAKNIVQMKVFRLRGNLDEGRAKELAENIKNCLVIHPGYMQSLTINWAWSRSRDKSLTGNNSRIL